MTQTIVEKVARAICLATVTPDDPLDAAGNAAIVDECWQNYRDEARAAIEALAGNVSNEMVTAMLAEIGDILGNGADEMTIAEARRRATSAAIRAALEE